MIYGINNFDEISKITYFLCKGRNGTIGKESILKEGIRGRNPLIVWNSDGKQILIDFIYVTDMKLHKNMLTRSSQP